jgi:acyl-CoA thioester hydrolase
VNKVTFEQEIYTFHIDFAGHVSNIVYVQWMEIGRLKLLEAADLPVDKVIRELGLLPTLIETNIRYKKQLFLGDRVHIEVWLSRLKNVSAVMEFRFFNNAGELIAEGQQMGLFIDKNTHRPTPLPKEAHQQFRKFLQEGNE